MNTKRLIMAILVGFVFVFATDFVIHGVWMKPDYAATKDLWRTESEMQARFPWMLGGQFLAGAMFVILWAFGFAERGSLRCAAMYGLMMGFFSQAQTLIMYVVSPLPPELAVKWFLCGLAQGVLLGVITALVYKPAASAGK